MDAVIVIGLLAIGLLLVFIELFLLPGTFVVGILGGVAMFIGVYLSYDFFGATAGHITLAVSVIFFAASLFLGYRTITSRGWALGDSVKGGTAYSPSANVKVGDKGRTYSVLRPSGKVEINGERVEAFSLGDYINGNVEVEVIKVERDKIFVKPISNG